MIEGIISIGLPKVFCCKSSKELTDEPRQIPACDRCAPALWFALLYNALTGVVNRCSESWADIDTELKRRYDLIPNLVTTVQAYAKHEKEVLERVTQARTVCHGEPWLA